MMSELTRLLARYRVRLGFVAAIAAFWLATPTRMTWIVGAAVTLVGEGLRVWAAGHLEKGREVTASGPYRFTRHPLYVGSSIIGLGFAVVSASVVVAALVVAYLALTIGAAIRREESHLTEKFGAAYPEYRDGRTDATGRFSLARVLRNREYRALIGLAIALALLAWKVI
jgi:protein-S-isoprenylcysteine O-methyltransferase Ste14